MPLVSVLLATRNDASHLGLAIASLLRQTVTDLELIVVDDCSTDGTPSLLAEVPDPRLLVLTNDRQLGLAASLNRALDRADGRYAARLDSDDVAFPERLHVQLDRLSSSPGLGIVGSAVLEIDEAGRPGVLHRNPASAQGIRWLSLFSSPFFHPTVVVERELVERHGIRYDPNYLESEDYDLWARLLTVADGANVADPLVLKRVHPNQASFRRSDIQISFQRQIAMREIAQLAPDLSATAAELAWGLGGGRGVPQGSVQAASESYLEVLASFERRYGVDSEVREAAAQVLVNANLHGRALRLGGFYLPRFAARRARRKLHERAAARRAVPWLAELAAPCESRRVVVVSPEPTPYRSPLLDRVAARPEIDLTVLYAARTVAGRTWSVTPKHRALFLRGARVPGLRGVLRHDYPVTPAIGRLLRRLRPEVVVVSGWSTYAAQAAIVWCRARKVPYVLLVESHDLGPRAGWRRAIKGAVVPRIVRGAASVLVVGTAARESVLARGARPERVRIFANTVDVHAWRKRADRLGERRAKLRAECGLGDDDVAVLSVGRLVFDKGLDVLISATAATDDRRLCLVFAGSGPDEHVLADLARELDVRLWIRGELEEAALAEEYVTADVFALLSVHETWGVVVNEAAASGLPLVLSERVGAARDLLRDGENGFVLPSGNVAATAVALKQLAADPALRRTAGARSRALVEGWGYEPSVESFVAAVREATSR